jgi:hypothetical protein
MTAVPAATAADVTYAPLWKLTHESRCSGAPSTPHCVCDPHRRIAMLKHMIAGVPLDDATRAAMLLEIQSLAGGGGGHKAINVALPNKEPPRI